MRAVMLHRYRPKSSQVGSVERRSILGMTVVGHQQFIPINLIHGHEIRDGFLESAESLVVLQVADVLADEGLAVHHQRDGVFQIGAQREDRTLARQLRHRPGSIAARPPQDDRTESAIANHGIVNPARDRPLPIRNASAIPERRCNASSSS